MECLKILNPIDKKLEKNIYLFIKFELNLKMKR